MGEASPAEIVGLLIGGAVIELDNGWQLTSARMAGSFASSPYVRGGSAVTATPKAITVTHLRETCCVFDSVTVFALQ